MKTSFLCNLLHAKKFQFSNKILRTTDTDQGAWLASDLFVRAWRRQRGEPARGGTDTAGRGELEGGEDEVEASWRAASSTTCGAARLPPDAAVLDPEHVQQQAGGRRAQG